MHCLHPVANLAGLVGFLHATLSYSNPGVLCLVISPSTETSSLLMTPLRTQIIDTVDFLSICCTLHIYDYNIFFFYPDDLDSNQEMRKTQFSLVTPAVSSIERGTCWHPQVASFKPNTRFGQQKTPNSQVHVPCVFVCCCSSCSCCLLLFVVVCSRCSSGCRNGTSFFTISQGRRGPVVTAVLHVLRGLHRAAAAGGRRLGRRGAAVRSGGGVLGVLVQQQQQPT